MTNHPSNKALITGATGFVGSHLTEKLYHDGWDVHIIVRPTSNLNRLTPILSGITVHVHDGTTVQMIAIMKKANPDVVFHIASAVVSQHEPEDIATLMDSNILFATQLIEAMIQNEVYHLINTGTSWQHYQNEAYNPVCLYAATKEAYETILKYYMEVTPLQVINLKLFDTYGPNDPRRKLIPLLQETAKTNESIEMSAGEQLIDLVHIRDVVNAFVVAADRFLNHKANQWEAYAVSSANPIKLKDMVKTYEKILERSLPITWGALPYRLREVMVPWNNGKKLPGWEPTIQLDEGLRTLES